MKKEYIKPEVEYVSFVTEKITAPMNGETFGITDTYNFGGNTGDESFSGDDWD